MWTSHRVNTAFAIKYTAPNSPSTKMLFSISLSQTHPFLTPKLLCPHTPGFGSFVLCLFSSSTAAHSLQSHLGCLPQTADPNTKLVLSLARMLLAGLLHKHNSSIVRKLCTT